METRDWQKNLAVTVANSAKPDERQALKDWAQSLLDIVASQEPATVKAKKAIAVTMQGKAILPALKIASRQIKQTGWTSSVH